MLFFKAEKYCGKTYGGYTILEHIGEGRYGMCFLAHSIDGVIVIIKRFKPSIFKKNRYKNHHEAVILSQIKHKAIPELLGVINEKGFYAFILEFKAGYTVKELIFKYQHKFTSKEVYNIGLQLIKIVKYVHRNGIVHRDIRIPNVLINKGQVYLVDFGLARWEDNIRYPYDLDFSYLGDFLLYLLYSTFEKKDKHKKSPWYMELNLTSEQKTFIQKLLGIKQAYENIYDIEIDFIKVFSMK